MAVNTSTEIGGDYLRGHLETMILSVVAREAAHGFRIMQQLDAESRGALHLKEGTLYPILYRLEKSGLLEAAWDESDQPRKGPRRRIYRITEKGTRELEQRRDSWRHFVATVGRIVEAQTWIL
jgi:DNA-binding PadR family transcriptional regulator